MVRSSQHSLNLSPFKRLTQKDFVKKFNLKNNMYNENNKIETIVEAPSELEKFSSKNVTLREKDKPLSNGTAEMKFTKRDKITSVRSKLSDFAGVKLPKKSNTKKFARYSSLKHEDILEEEFAMDDESRTQKLGTIKRDEDFEFESNLVMHASERATYKHIPGDFESRNMKTLVDLKNRNDGIQFLSGRNYSRKPSSPTGIGKISFIKDQKKN